jgi:hypothetical protein
MSTATVPASTRAHDRRRGLLAFLPMAVVAAAGLILGIVHDDGRPATRTRAEVVASLDPQARAYVLGVVNMPPAQLAAGLGNVPYSGPADPGPRLHAGHV